MNAFQPPAHLAASVAPVIRADAVADLLNYRSAATFYSRRQKLEAAGFPKKLPGVNGWSSACILRWIETNGETHMPEALEPAPARRPSALEQRYA